MSNRESIRQFRRKSRFLEGDVGSFDIKLAQLRRSHEEQLAELFGEDEDGDEGYQENWGSEDRTKKIVYSDTESEDSSCLSEDSDEFEERKNQKQEKLLRTQRRFAAIFDQNTNIEEDIEIRKHSPLANNSLIPPTIQEEDFRNRRKPRIRPENYFGQNAKSSFLNRYHWMSHEQSVLDNATEDLATHTIFEENAIENNHAVEYPFMPRRPSAEESTSLDGYEDDSVSLMNFDVKGGLAHSSSSPGHSTADSYDTFSVNTLDLSASMKFNKENETTPRTKFIASCIQAKVQPRASLLLRKNVSTELNLQHQGMGDKMAIVLAQSIPDLPLVHSVNLMDNNLTDVGLQPIIKSLGLLSSLTKINLSQNTINRESATALASYVSKAPLLKELVLHHADIDDYECTMFVAAIADNEALTELDLSNNEIGTAELLNNVKPDVVTGAESLADFLSSRSCKLTTLHVQWNKIRLGGAVSLAESLMINESLIHLNLSYNALGAKAGEVLGHSLLINQSLKTLNLASNNINSSACFTICMGLIDNYSIKYVNLDSNPIGQFGLRMVMQMPLEVGSRIKMSAQRCNLSRVDPKDEMFSHDSPARTYELKLDEPFQRAICLRLLRLVATHKNYKFKSFGYLKPKSKSRTPRNKRKGGRRGRDQNAEKGERIRQIKLIHTKNSDKLDNLDEATSNILENLYKLERAAGNEELAEKLFNEYDSDGNGSLDVDEIHILIKNIGLHFDRPTLVKAIQLFDVDGAGTLEYDEFMQFLRAQREEARSRIKELTENPVMASTKMTTVKYFPPKVGTMFIDVEDSFATSGHDAVMSTSAHSTMMDIIRGGTESTAKLLSFSIQHAKIHLREAVKIFQALSQEIKDPAMVVKMLLPRMANTKEAKQFLLTSLSDVGALNRLRKLMGSCLNPMIGLYNGYYELDLTKREDKACMTKLIEQSQKVCEERMDKSLLGRGMTGDLSQKGDWSCFRNELKNGEPIQITVSMFNPMPSSGTYRFDFSGADKPPRKTIPMSDERCMNVLINLELLSKGKKIAAGIHLENMKRKSMDNNPGEGNFDPIIKTKQQAEEIQYYMLRFYSKNHERHIELSEARENENLKTTVTASESEAVGDHRDPDDDDFSSSSSEGEYHDDENNINYIPLFRRGSMESRGDHTGAALQRQPSQLAVVDEEQSEGSESDSAAPSVDNLSSDDEKVAQPQTMTMLELQNQAEQLKGESLKTLTGSMSFKHSSSEKSLLDQFSEKFDEQVESPYNHRGTMRGIRASKLLRMGEELVKNKKTSNSEDDLNLPLFNEKTEETGMSAGRQKRTAVTKVLSNADRYLLERQQRLIKIKAKNGMTNPRSRAIKMLSSLIDVFQRVWMRSRHLALILHFFRDGCIVRMPSFGSYRVELIVMLFSRIVDPQNLDLVLEKLTTQEIACVYCRLGILNFFNPLKLEGCYSLDISRYEERVVAKILAALSTIEPGENWLNETFRWEYFAECIPGWELTKSWLKDENMPHRGYLFLEYYSGGCTKFGVPLRMNGCQPNIAFRKSLLAMCYVDEDTIIEDESNCDANGNKVHKKATQPAKHGKLKRSSSSGVRYLEDFKEYWEGLLAPKKSTSAKIGRGESTEAVFSNSKHSTWSIVRDLPDISDVFFGNVIIDKTSEKGQRMLEKMHERVARREQEAMAMASRGKGDASQAPGKKKMDLSIGTRDAVSGSISLPPPSSTSRTKLTPLDKLLQDVALETAISEAEDNDRREVTTSGNVKSKAKKDSSKADNLEGKIANQQNKKRQTLLQRTDSMVTVREKKSVKTKNTNVTVKKNN